MNDQPRTKSTGGKAKAAATHDFSVMIKALNEKEQSNPKGTCPKGIKNPFCSLRWNFMAWCQAYPSIVVITAKKYLQTYRKLPPPKLQALRSFALWGLPMKFRRPWRE